MAELEMSLELDFEIEDFEEENESSTGWNRFINTKITQ